MSSSSSSPAEASAISLRKEGSIQGPSGTRDKTNSTTSFMMQTRSSEKREGKEQMDVVASAAASDLGENEASSDSSSSMDNNTSSLSSSGENRQGKVYSQQKLLQHKQKTLLPLQLKHHGQQRDRNMPKLQAAGPSVPSHIVTDVSLSHLTGSSSSNNATTTSGGNTGSGSNTGGSSSNRGSSGSGNDGKGGGSSEEQQKEENSGDATNGSDGSSRDLVGSSARPVISGRADSALAKLHGNMGSMQATSHHQQQLHDPAKLRFTSFDSVVGDSAGIAFENRESKRWNKKRKRIEMRREYEAKQHMESSDSSDSSFNDDPVFKPGRPVTLDQVVVVSKIPMYERLLRLCHLT